MDMTLLVPSALLAIALVALAWALAQWRGVRGRLDEIMTANEAEIGRLRAELDSLRAAASEADRAATEARTALSGARERIDALTRERDTAAEAGRAAETRAAVTAKEIETLRVQMADWEKTKEQHMNAANAALLESGRKAMGQLLETHKREAEAAKKQQEEQVRKTTENLLEQVAGVGKAVAALQERDSETRDRMDTVMRALSSPGGAGHYAEIGLENTLKSFGLEKGRDFFLQHTLEGRRLRPDALLLLPGDTLWVIDSKASKHFLDLAAAEGTEAEDDAYKALAATMNTHLRALADKNYRSEIMAAYRETGRSGDARRVMSIMYVPHDGAMEKIARADPDFVAKAARAEITIAGPSMLMALVGFARIEIDLGKQAENQEKIVEGAQALVESVAVVVDHAGSVGRGLKTAANAYGKMARSINGRLLPRARGIEQMGVRSGRNKPLPRALSGFQVVEDTPLIEGDAEEVADLAAIEDGTRENGDD